MSDVAYKFYLIRWKLGKVNADTLNSLVPSKLTQSEVDAILSNQME